MLSKRTRNPFNKSDKIIKNTLAPEQDLNSESLYFKELFENLPEAAAIIDENGKIIKINKAFEKLFKYGNGELNNKSIDRHIAKGKYEKEAKEFTGKTLKGRKVNIETVRHTKKGKPIPVHIQGIPIKVDNKTKRVFAIYRNISEQYQTKKELNASVEMFKLIFENSPLTIFHYDKSGVITACNKKQIELLGITEIIIGYDILNSHQDDTIKNLIQESLSGKNGHYEGRIKFNNRKHNSYLKIDTAPITSVTGDVIGGIALVENITNRIKAENDLKKAKERAVEADSLKTAFLANMSHEIRTPMNAIIGFSDLLADPDVTSGEREDYINIIKNNGNILLNIIDDIIDIAKIEAGQLKIYKTQCPINEILYELYTYFNKQKKAHKKNNLDLVLHSGKHHNTTILSDPFRLRQILSNLLSNALKFTEDGQIKFGYTIEENSKIKFFVKDTGIGIEKEKVNQIFDRFRQADLSNTRKYGGTGLGLTISKNLVELLGGEMWVESEQNNGSAFYFTLPFQKINNTMSIPRYKPQNEIKYNWKGNVVLIVEDDVTNYKFLEKALQKTNVEILWAEDGIPAVELIESGRKIDLILMDIQMPKMDGHEATRRIKSIRKEIPIIAQTAYVMSGERDKCLKAGCDDYLAKPIKITQLFNKMRKYLG